MLLSTLLQDLTVHPIQHDRDITGLSLDHHTIHPGYLFIAHQEGDIDGRAFIQDAIKKGALSILVEAEDNSPEILLRNSVSIIPIVNLNAKISEIAARFYHHPAKVMQLIGISGIQGKTSCAYFLTSLLKQQLNTLVHNIDTDQNALALQQSLAELIKQKPQKMIMTIPPTLTIQNKINNLDFLITIFTNLPKNISETPAAYLLEHSAFSIVNFDEDYGYEITETVETPNKVFAYSISESAVRNKTNENVPLIFADNIRVDLTGIYATINSPWGTSEIHLTMFGRFNLSNSLAVLTALCLLDIPFINALSYIAHLQPAPGRMQLFGGRVLPTLVLDCANTADTLERVLFALREHCHRKLYCICSNDELKATAEMYSDQVVITSEKDKLKIIQDIFKNAVVGDCILITGNNDKEPINDALSSLVLP